jgi:hypothetical protein
LINQTLFAPFLALIGKKRMIFVVFYSRSRHQIHVQFGSKDFVLPLRSGGVAAPIRRSWPFCSKGNEVNV